MKGLQVRTPEEMDALRARVRERLALYREAKDLLAEPLREYGSVDDLFAAVDRHAEERNCAEKQVSLADAYPDLTEFVRDQVQDAEQLTLGGMIAALGGDACRCRVRPACSP